MTGEGAVTEGKKDIVVERRTRRMAEPHGVTNDADEIGWTLPVAPIVRSGA
ncbi:hypothetical protein K7957_16295 [Sphingomonas yunnanensis]|nr:hypothetical protein [Sphingomonas yunnanensis]